MANFLTRKLLEFAELQLAAEAFLSQSQDNEENRPPEDLVSSRLEVGNEHTSRFMPSQAQEFATKFRVLQQYRNDPLKSGGSGFSGTLFQNKETGELTLSFRSTEFIDDAVRDTKSTNELEIRDLGWAFGQISEMEAWYAQLQAPGGPLHGRSFFVTGYSLGGHLATAFNILRREEFQAGDIVCSPIVATFTFNGAGTGSISTASRLSDVLANFNRIRTNYATSEEWSALTSAEQDLIRGMAQARVDKINAEQIRVAGLEGVTRAFAESGATAPAGIQADIGYQIAALFAAQETVGALDWPFAQGVNDRPTSPRFVADELKFSNMTESVGMERGGLSTSFVSNSGLHYGTREEVFIEDQPLIRGGLFPLEWAQSNLLVENPGENDFGDTHSLALLVDSLSVIAVLEELDPTFTLARGKELFELASSASAATELGSQGRAEGDVLERVVDALYKLLSPLGSKPPLDYFTPLSGNTWHLSNLRAPFHLKVAEIRTVIQDMRGQDGVLDLQVRLLSEFSTAQRNEMRDAMDGAGLAYRYALKELNPFLVIGATDFYSAHNLNGELGLYDPETGLGMTDTFLSSRAEMLGWKDRYFEADGKLTLRTKQSYTHQFIDKTFKDTIGDDLTLSVLGLKKSIAKTTFGGDAGEVLTGGDVTVGDRLFGGGGDDTLAGNAGRDYLEGDAGADKIDGGLGNDVLMGGTQDDILEGGKGNDTLDGGEGGDRYVYRSGDGVDTMVDADGLGSIQFFTGPSSWAYLTGGRKDFESGGTWRSSDGQFFYSLLTELDETETLTVSHAGGTLLIKDFVNGKLGIILEDAQPSEPLEPPTSDREVRGDFEPMVFVNPEVPPGYTVVSIPETPSASDFYLIDELGNYVRDPSRPLLSEDDFPFLQNNRFLWGGDGNDHLVASNFGNDMAGSGGNDYIEGGTSLDHAGGGDGNDFLEGGSFADIALEEWLNRMSTFPEGDVLGGVDDFLVGHAGDDVIFGGVAEDLDSLLDPATPAAGHKGDLVGGMAGDDELYGSTGDDLMLGGHGKDAMVGGPGNDVLDGDDHFFTSHTGLLAAAGGIWTVDRGPGPFEIRFFPVSVTPLRDDSAYYYKLAGDDDELFGGTGNDVLIGMLGNDRLLGEDGNDTASGWEGSDRLLGGSGDDVLAGDFGAYEQRNDRLIEFGNFVTPGYLGPHTGDSGPVDLTGSDFLDGEGGNDLLYGEGGEDVVLGGDGQDQLWGDAPWLPGELHGADYLAGGGGDDVLYGGGGDDMLLGGAGNDKLDGGEDSDTYIFGRGDGHEIIADSGESGIDVLRVGYAVDQVTVNRQLNGSVTITGLDGDQIIVAALAEEESFGIEEIRFSDGTSLGSADFAAIPVDESGIGGPDWSTFSALNETIDASEYEDDGISMVDAGAGDDLVTGISRTLSFGNAGNDSLFGGHALFGGEGNDFLADGHTLSGGPGNDRLINGSILDGGAGNDTLDGGVGADRYFIAPHSGGADFVQDTSGWSDEFFDAYYRALGIEDWESRRGLTKSEYHYDPGDNPSILHSLEELRQYFGDPDMTLEEAVAKGVEVHDPLPALEIAANDYAALEAYYESGVLQPDRIDFGEGISLGDVAFAWGRALADLDPQSDIDALGHATLDLLWGQHGSLRIVIPNAGDPIGSGIERVTFADGSLYTIAELMAMAPAISASESPVPNLGTADADDLSGSSGSDRILGMEGDDRLDGNGGNDEIEGHGGEDTLAGGTGDDVLLGGEGDDRYEFGAGDGIDRIVDTEGVDTLSFGEGIASESVILGLGSLRLAVGDSGDVVHIEGFDPGDVLGSAAIEFFQFADGTLLDLQELVSRGFDLAGTLADDVIVGTNTGDRINGFGGDDTLAGGEGDDTYLIESGGGSDYISDGGGDNTVRFGEGIAPEGIVAFRGPDTLTLESGGEMLTIRWQPDEGYGVRQFEFADGSVVTSADLLGRVGILGTPDDDEIEGGEDNDSIRGLEGSDDLYGAEGNDVLEGGDGDDGLSGGEGDDILDGGNGLDDMEGEAGNDTYVFGRGYSHDFIYDEDETPGNADIIQFKSGILPANVTVTADLRGSLHFIVDGGPDRLTIWDWFTRESQKIERVQFDDGTEWDIAETESRIVPATPSPYDDGLSGDGGNDRIFGLAGRDDIFGADGNDALSGGDGDDYLNDRSGRNHVAGGDGADYLEVGGATLIAGGPGDDVIDLVGEGGIIAVNRGDGNDIAFFYPFNGIATFTLSLGKGITAADLTLERSGSDLLLGTGPGEVLRLEGWYSSGGPSAATGLLQLIGSEVQKFDFLAVTDAFDLALAAQPDIGPWRAEDALGGSLVDVSQDHAIGGEIAYRYAGTGDTDGLSTTIIQATLDNAGFGFVSQEFVVRQNQAPTLGTAVADIAAVEDLALSYVLGADIFRDPDGDDLTYFARLEDDGPLPEWLAFDASGLSLSGTPRNQDVGSLQVKLTAVDPGGLAISDVFTVTVENANDAPEILAAIDDKLAEEDAQFIFAIPDDTFTDADAEDTLDLQAVLANGSSLPDWLHFAPDSGTFSGAPGNGDVGVLAITVTATDRAGLRVSDTFNLSIGNTNDAPEVILAVDDQAARAGEMFSFTLPTQLFRDVDVGDSLSYTATLADGSALPGWLHFDTSAHAFHGTPAAGDEGTLTVAVTARDSSGATGAAKFGISIVPPAGMETGGSRNDDVVTGTDFEDLLFGYKGGDTLRGGASDDLLAGEQGNDQLFGDDGDDKVMGGDGRDSLWGGAGKDSLDGGKGHDRLEGGADDDLLQGDKGNDWLLGTQGDDVLEGAQGRDRLEGGSEDDLLAGGRGNDALEGGDGNDVYLHEQGGGRDTVADAGGTDILLFGEGIRTDMVRIQRRHDDLLLNLKGGHGSVTIEDWFQSGSNGVETVQFSDGAAWDLAALVQSSMTRRPSGRSLVDDGPAAAPAARLPGGHGEIRERAIDTRSRHAGIPPDGQESLLEAYLAGPARHDVALPWLQGIHSNVSSSDDVTRKWRRVNHYLSGMLDDRSEDSRQGAATLLALEIGAAGGVTGRSFGYAGSIGISRNAANMRTLQGLEEGFERVHG